MFSRPVEQDLGFTSWTWPSMPPCRQKLIDLKMFDPHEQYFKRGGHMPLMCFLGAIASNVGQRTPPKDGHGGQKKEDGGRNSVGRVGAVLTPVVTGLIGVDCIIGGVLGAAVTTRGVFGAAMTSRGVLGEAMTRGMPGAAMANTRGVPGTAMTTCGMPGDG